MELEAGVDRVFAFHADPHNISAISPGWQRVEVKEGNREPKAGDRFEIVVKFFGLLPLHWRGIWREVDEPSLLVDEALGSPFVYWRHQHEFKSLGDHRTLMIDDVSYLFPGGWFGKWVGETFGRLQFQFMFADRHARTRRWMREHS